MSLGLTVAELARRQGYPERRMLAVLEQERARGHVEEVDGRWCASRVLLAEFGQAFEDAASESEETA